MVNIIRLHQSLAIECAENTLIETDQLKQLSKREATIITTGSQEIYGALSRMAADIHKKISIMPVTRSF